MTLHATTMPCPNGKLDLAVDDDGALVRIELLDHAAAPCIDGLRGREADRRCAAACGQLAEYFAGTRRDFDLVLRPIGTPFQKSAWRQLERIPYGETISYAQQAARMGNRQATRAVGGANGKNPLPIVIPCHRVIGKDGTLGGFTGGLDKKRWLLAHEEQQLTRGTRK